ncbi:MAG: heavy metal translocating P-type ATPase [Alkalispirochaeta sp.]
MVSNARRDEPRLQIIELPVRGMDCADCARHVQNALEGVAGVQNVTVLLGAERAKVTLSDPSVDPEVLRRAVQEAGYTSPETGTAAQRGTSGEMPSTRTPAGERTADRTRDAARPILSTLGIVFAVVLLVVVGGEWFGVLDGVSERIPWWAGLAVVIAGGYPVFLSVFRNALRKKVISHTLMTLGVIAAIVVGEWITAAIVVLFMRIGDYTERATTERSREAVRGLERLIPRMALRISSHDAEAVTVPVEELQQGDLVLVRPGERIPVDGTVLDGTATVDQSTITGESVPRDVAPEDTVYAATILTTGSIRVGVDSVGTDTAYGRVVRLAEEAEANRGEVQRVADRFSTRYLPIVLAVAAGTYLIGRDPLATAAVLVVACSCSFALATPIAMMASIGASARRGLLIKGGVHIEMIPRITTVLLDKTGTVTLGRPAVTAFTAAPGHTEAEVLAVAAAAERDSQHPVATAILAYARARGVVVPPASEFRSIHGHGVTAMVEGRRVSVHKSDAPSEGETLLDIAIDGEPAGTVALADEIRPGVRDAVDAIRRHGIRRIEVITGDNDGVARRIATQIGVDYRADLLPEDKIAIVREYQQRGERVMMIGDGVNDTPALVQADVGVAMAAIGSDIAIEAAHVCLLREEWSLIPTLFATARRTMRVVYTNIALTGVYNLLGLTLAAVGILPPVLAAAAQSIPDVGILANSSRLLRHARKQSPRG